MESRRRVKRTFTPDQKFELIQEIENSSTKNEALKKHGIAHSMYARWKRQLKVGINSSLRSGRPPINHDFKQLKMENRRLKEIVLNLSAQMADLKKEMNLD